MKNKVLTGTIIFILIINIFTGEAKSSEINITMEENKIVGLIRFIYAISGTDRASNTLLHIYMEKRKDKSTDEIYIEKFKKALLDLPTPLHLYYGKDAVKDYMLDSPRHRTTSILYYYASVSKDINDFKFLISGVFPDEYINDLIDGIDYFLPVYEELYYNQSEKELKNLIIKGNKEKSTYYEILQKSHNFYKSSISEPEIRIILVPLYISDEDFEKYKETGNFTTEGQSLGNLQIIEVIIPQRGEIGFEWFISIHETVHYFQSTSSLNKDMLKAMEDYDPLYGKIAGTYIDEAIATIIQMYGASIKNKNDIFDSGWYNDKIIDGYGKALYREVIEYIEKDKTLDKDLAIEAVDIFKETFPNAYKIKEVVFQEINVMTGEFDVMEVMPAFRCINAASIYGNPPLNNQEVLDNYKDLKCTQVFIIKENELHKLSPYKIINSDEIRNLAEKNKNFAYIIFNEEKNNFNIILISEDREKLESLLRKLNEEETIKEGFITL